MNVTDLIVIGIILIAGIIGLTVGVIKMTYKVASYVLSILLAIKFAKPVADYFKSADFYFKTIDKIYDSILGRVVTSGATLIDNINETLNTLSIPENIKSQLALNAMESSSSTVSSGINPTAYAVSTSITNFLLVVVAGIALFVIIKILFMFFNVLVDKICKAPVIKQIDKGSGFILGCIIGLLIIFSLCTAVTMMSSSENKNTIMDLIDHSTTASFLYNNNPITKMLANII